jgi:hypothetical protein
MGDVLDATEAAIKAASHLTDMDKGAIEALRSLAAKIDAWDVIVDWANDDVEGVEGKRPAVPANDNVSIPTYLKFCESLGLTPTGRTRAQIEGGGDGGSGALGKLRLAHGKKGA